LYGEIIIGHPVINNITYENISSIISQPRQNGYEARNKNINSIEHVAM
jgi:hypothetical protein